MDASAREDELVIPLVGKIDSGNAAEAEAFVTSSMEGSTAETLVFDAAQLDYISSAGLRVLLRAMKTHPGHTEIRNVSSDVYEILEMTGFTEFTTVRKSMREVSVEGCEVIGRGFYGTVYRIDPDTIVKVYSSPDSIPLIEHERAMARLAFVKGIPTAISYDIVKVGDSYGSVFELLRAKTMNDLLVEHPEQAEEVIDKYVELMHVVHDTELELGELPSARTAWMGYLDVIRGAGLLPEEMLGRLQALIEAVPEMGNIVHGDFHMKNVMVADGEPMLIDMDTLTQGSPIFDLQGVFVTYQAYAEDDPNNTMEFLGIDNDMATLVWRRTLERYFDTDDPETLSRLSDKIRLLAYVRFLQLNAIDPSEDELDKLRARHAREHVEELLGRVDSLELV